MKTIRICSKTYNLKFNKKSGGAKFSTIAKTGRGEIILGTKHGLEKQATNLIHESLESILVEDNKRFYGYTNSSDEPYLIFIFDHDYLCSLEHKLFDALISSGFFKLMDGKK